MLIFSFLVQHLTPCARVSTIAKTTALSNHGSLESPTPSPRADFMNLHTIEPLPIVSASPLPDEISHPEWPIIAVEPKCPSAMLQWQHGTFRKFPNGSLLLTPFAVDGRQLLSAPCTMKGATYLRYNMSELFEVSFLLQWPGLHRRFTDNG